MSQRKGSGKRENNQSYEKAEATPKRKRKEEAKKALYITRV
jgi:hypothetical protein